MMTDNDFDLVTMTFMEYKMTIQYFLSIFSYNNFLHSNENVFNDHFRQKWLNYDQEKVIMTVKFLSHNDLYIILNSHSIFPINC